MGSWAILGSARMAQRSMVSDPRVHKPRLPKAYTDQQLAFLKRSVGIPLPISPALTLPQQPPRVRAPLPGLHPRRCKEIRPRTRRRLYRPLWPSRRIYRRRGVRVPLSRGKYPPHLTAAPFSDGTSKYTTGSKTPSAAPDASSRAALGPPKRLQRKVRVVCLGCARFVHAYV